MKQSLFVATPMYGGFAHGEYADSMMKLAVECASRGIDFEFVPVFNESHIDRGRIMLVDLFRRSNKTHFMFIDADLGFQTKDPIAMLSLADPATDKDVVCGFYPKKVINWANVAKAVKLGLADKDPLILEQFAGDMVFTPALNDDSYKARSIYDPVKIHEGGTGFMMIQRHVFDRIEADNPDLWCLKRGDKPDRMTVFFDAKIDPDRHPYPRFLTEDYDFCRLVRNSGMNVWLCPWIKLVHYGSYRFIGNVEAISMLQMTENEMAA